MAGGGDDAKITGFAKYFNSVTDRGRANVAMSSLGGLVILGVYLYFKPKSKPQEKK